MTANRIVRGNFPVALSHVLDFLASRSRREKQAIVITVDAAQCLLAAWIAYYLRLGEWRFFTEDVIKLTAGALAFWFTAAALVGVYREVFRYAGAGTMFTLARAIGLMLVPMIALYLIALVPGVPRTLSVLQPLILFLMLVSSRVFLRYIILDLRMGVPFEGVRRRTLIFGAGDAGRSLASAIRHDPGMELIGFVDDDERKQGRRLDRCMIYPREKIGGLIETSQVTDIFLAIPRLSRSARAALVGELSCYAVNVMTLPAMRDIIEGDVTIADLRRVEISDLLGRPAVKPDQGLMAMNVTDHVVMVTGAGGSIGSELCVQIARLKPSKLVLVELSEFALYTVDGDIRSWTATESVDFEIVPELCNISDGPSIRRVMQRHKPQTVFHAAAYKHVPLVEANVIGGTRNNVLGTWHFVRAALETGVRNFTLISTDKAVRPTNIMGASKRICEQILQAHAADPVHSATTTFTMVRFGNVLGSSGSVVPLFTRQIQAGGPITLTDKRVTRFFMTIPEAAELVIQAGAMARGGEVYVLDMGSPVRILDLARTMINLSGLEVRDEQNPDGDIEIAEVGLRPGEKLYEELLIGENPKPTPHGRIMQAREDFLPLEELEPMISRLTMLLDAGHSDGVREMVAALVPQYRSPGNEAGAEACNAEKIPLAKLATGD